ncbi:hypothetical protein SAMD00019534_030970 [Acytostelium subglobosum LB1]|uniref:hypothetical protein n=1 Tax=Acytostelium subglobosum LB1 TaxID=1410327 RepID=UPI000644E1D5|nr:hypothetical protein SAMD00019534_030970 [Acytostelium subglobosum LB1]GAM19922.1 hypothetical protein SAMD00019534_030970 [Acytostelium subglobosum LB1]|eukprot:XP_012756684.1 hypothetical protein SAMD00019534_030970 [Acytostelium subglobosum LB1]
MDDSTVYVDSGSNNNEINIINTTSEPTSTTTTTSTLTHHQHQQKIVSIVSTTNNNNNNYDADLEDLKNLESVISNDVDDVIVGATNGDDDDTDDDYEVDDDDDNDGVNTSLHRQHQQQQEADDDHQSVHQLPFLPVYNKDKDDMLEIDDEDHNKQTTAASNALPSVGIDLFDATDDMDEQQPTKKLRTNSGHGQRITTNNTSNNIVNGNGPAANGHMTSGMNEPMNIDRPIPPAHPTSSSTSTTTTTSSSRVDSNGIDISSALSLNLEYQRSIKRYLEKIESAIEKNQDLLRKAKASFTNTTSKSNKHSDKKPGHPYFALETGELPPDNPDTILVKQHFGTMPVSFKGKRWTKADCMQLAKGIREKNLQLKLFEISEKNLSKEEYQREMQMVSNLTERDMEINLVGINWEHISSEYLSLKTPLECELRWKNHEHPSINKEPFTKEEDKKLLELAKKYQGHDWSSICRELGTGRSPIQCCQRYQRSLNTNFMKREWTKEEDEILMSQFLKYNGMGERSWQRIAEALDGRTGHQCLHRWQKTLDPTIKRGRWSDEEDDQLRKAVELYGRGNWILIKNHVPGRTDMQCRERWCNVMDPVVTRAPWTDEEDAKLKTIVDRLGMGKWAQVAKEMVCRTDNQCWRRWKTLNSKSPLLQEYQELINKKKQMIVSNFVGRKKERPAFTADDFVPLERMKDIAGSQEAGVNPDTPKRKRRSSKKGTEQASDQEDTSSPQQQPFTIAPPTVSGPNTPILTTPPRAVQMEEEEEEDEESPIVSDPTTPPTTTTTTTTTTSTTTTFTLPEPGQGLT